MTKKIIYDKPSDIGSILNKSEVKAAIDYIGFFQLPGSKEHPAPDGKVYAAARYAETEEDFRELFLHKYGSSDYTDSLRYAKERLLIDLDELKSRYEQLVHKPALGTYREESTKKWVARGSNFMKWIEDRNEDKNFPVDNDGGFFSSDIIDRIYEYNKQDQAFEHIGKLDLADLLNNPANSEVLIRPKHRGKDKVRTVIYSLSLRVSDMDRDQWRGLILEKIEGEFKGYYTRKGTTDLTDIL